MFFLQMRTRDVLDAAPWMVRAQLWCLAFLGVLILASVRVYARAGGSMTNVPITSWWPFVLAVLSWAVSVGVWLSQVAELKKRADGTDARLLAIETTFVKRDKLDDKLETMAAKIEAVHKLLEQSDRNWRESLHGAKE